MVSGHPGDPFFPLALWHGGDVATTASAARPAIVDSAGQHAGFCPTGFYIFRYFPTTVISFAVGVVVRLDTDPDHFASGSTILVPDCLPPGDRSKIAGLDVRPIDLYRSRLC